MSLFGNTKVRECIIGSIHLLKQIPGYSAYEIAVKHGFKGTEEEWLSSLKGKDGKKGDKGDPGSIEISGEFNALGKNISNVAAPVNDGDAVNKKYAEDKIAEKIAESNASTDAKIAEKIAKNIAENNDAVMEYAHNTFMPKQLDGVYPSDFCEQTVLNNEGDLKFVADFGFMLHRCGGFLAGKGTVTAYNANFAPGEVLFCIKEPYIPEFDDPLFITNLVAYDSNDNIVDTPFILGFDDFVGSVNVISGSNANVRKITFNLLIPY